jgi:NAD(P) transhydrogenase subunit alpha
MTGAVDPFVLNLTVFVLAIFIGYHVVWNVTPALHTPLMSVTNAISGIIIVGAMLAAGPEKLDIGTVLGLVAVTLAAVNVFGGFLVTQRMLDMFKKKGK